MFGKIREKYGRSEVVQSTSIEVSDEGIDLAKKVMFLSSEPSHGPNPQLESALTELAAELGVPDMELKAVQAKAHEIVEQLN